MTHTFKPSKNYFLQRVSINADTGCWNWLLFKNRDGYGIIQLHAFSTNQAHRASYEFFVGPISPGLEVDHLCRNPACVNPYHLEPVTRRENQLRGIGFCAQNGRKTHCDNGHEFTPQSTYIRANGNRGCRECNRLAVARYRARKSA